MSNKIALIFPPTHDFSMPYLAPAQLKGFLEYHLNIECKYYDLNNLFYINSIGIDEFKNRKNKLLDHIINGNILSAVNGSIELEEYCQEQLENIESENYKFSLKKITPSYNQYYSKNIIKELSVVTKLEEYIKTVCNKIKLFKNRIYGITISVEDQIIPAFIICKLIKQTNSNSIVILGGSIPTRLSNEISCTDLSKFIDYIVKHEGERSLLNILSFLNGEKKKSIIANDKKIIDLHSNKNHPVENQINFDNHEIMDLNNSKFYPNFDDLNLDNYLVPERIIPLNITRRCYWAKCDFCAIYYTWDPKHRAKSVINVVDEIKYYMKNYNVRFFRIVDEDIPPNILEEFASTIIQENIKFYYEIYSRFEKKFLCKKFCTTLYQSGCRQIFFGLENIGEKTLKLINKGRHINQKNITRILENLYNVGISNYLFLLFGVPHAPEEDEKLTVDYIINNNTISTVAIGTFLVDRYSPIHLNSNITEKYKITLFNKGDMTTEIGYKYRNIDTFNSNKNRTKSYLESIFLKRPDLAISSLLNEEIRLVLTSKFGHDFTRTYIQASSIEHVSSIVGHAVYKTASERIFRKLF